MRRRHREVIDPEYTPLHLTQREAAKAFVLLSDLTAKGSLDPERIPDSLLRKMRAFQALGKATIYISEEP